MDDTPRPLTDHLAELRRRLFWAIGTWLAFAAVAGYWAQDVFRILMRPAVAAALRRDTRWSPSTRPKSSSRT
jgi:Sec-independent protein secretion pathway component TatC